MQVRAGCAGRTGTQRSRVSEANISRQKQIAEEGVISIGGGEEEKFV